MLTLIRPLLGIINSTTRLVLVGGLVLVAASYLGVGGLDLPTDPFVAQLLGDQTRAAKEAADGLIGGVLP